MTPGQEANGDVREFFAPLDSNGMLSVLIRIASPLEISEKFRRDL